MTVRKRTAWLVAAAVAVSAAWPSAAPSTWSKAALTAILDQYASGNYEAATRAIAAIDQLSLHESQDTPETPFTNWQHAAPDWIRKGSSTAESNRRKLIAATVALDIVRAHPEVGLLQRLPFLAWACTRVRDHATGSDVERLWYLASVAVLEDMGWGALRPAEPNVPVLRSPEYGDVDNELGANHLRHALKAFPNEERFHLAEVLARASVTSVTSFSHSPNQMDANDLPIKNPPPAGSLQALRVAERLATLPAIERDLEALARDERLHAEAELNRAYLSARRQQWDVALTELDDVTSTAREPFLICVSHHLRGWVYQRTGRLDGAISEYRAALEIAPHARTTSILLADALEQSGHQVEAYSLLDATFKASNAASIETSRQILSARAGPPARAFIDARTDPWVQFQHGDARLVPDLFVKLREALR